MLNELKKVQKQCDDISFVIFGKKYSELTPQEILRHKCFHIANLLAKISAVCEKYEHDIEAPTDRIIDEVIPDLIVYALQLANAFNVDLDQKYKERVEFIVDKGKQYHAPRVYDTDLHEKLKEKLGVVMNRAVDKQDLPR